MRFFDRTFQCHVRRIAAAKTKKEKVTDRITADFSRMKVSLRCQTQIRPGKTGLICVFFLIRFCLAAETDNAQNMICFEKSRV